MRTLQTALCATAGISMFMLPGCGTSGGAAAGDPPGDLTPEVLEGRWSADQTGDPFLEFGTDSTVIGTDGCNGINSLYTIDGATIRIEPWVTTAKGCPGIDTWLSGARTAEITGSDEMTVRDSDGTEIGTLIRERQQLSTAPCRSTAEPGRLSGLSCADRSTPRERSPGRPLPPFR